MIYIENQKNEKKKKKQLFARQLKRPTKVN